MSHFAVWPAAYAVGCLLVLGWLAGRAPEPSGAAFVLLVAHAGYLFDRVKLGPARLDPADRAALPARFDTIERRQAAVRAVVGAEFAAATALAWTIHPALCALPALAGLGVWWYAGRPAGGAVRPKDRPLVKAGLVVGAHVGLGALVLAATGAGLASLFRAAGPLAGLVLADAVLCDMDDAPTDRLFGTRTLPVELGPAGAWGVVALATAGGVAASFAVRPAREAAVFGTLAAASVAAAALAPRRRDLVDARMIAVGLACVAML
jgi:4-hydroxybenzoate polyprenyltransferase